MRRGAQGQSVQPRGESTKDGQSRGQGDEGVEKAKEISTQRKILLAPYHLEASHSTFFSGKQPSKVKFCREYKPYNSFKHGAPHVCKCRKKEEEVKICNTGSIRVTAVKLNMISSSQRCPL